LERLAALVALELARVLHPRLVQILRWEPDGSVTVAGSWGDGPSPFPPGRSWEWDDPSLAGAPIVVDGEPWGHIGVAMTEGMPLPDGVEERLAQFTELVATAINSATTRE
jgi:GAF domain-containing protein